MTLASQTPASQTPASQTPATAPDSAPAALGAQDADQLSVALIVGSVRTGRFGPTIARWLRGRADAHPELAAEVVDLAECRLPLDMAEPTDAPGEGGAPPLLSPRLAAADAFVVVTPEYNHSFPAGLKNAIDWHHAEWQAKPVGFVSYGGISGGLRAVEQLRLVFAELHAVTIRDSVSFPHVWQQFDASGRPTDPAGCGGAATAMFDQLAWWARALREARARRPYVVG